MQLIDNITPNADYAIPHVESSNAEHLLKTISELTTSNVKHLEDIRHLQTQLDVTARKNLGLQYKLVDTVKARELYQSATSVFFTNATVMSSANSLTDCMTLVRNSVTQLFKLNAVDVLFRTLGGTYDTSIPVSEYFNNTDLSTTFLNTKQHIDTCQRLNYYSLTQCNTEQMYNIGCTRNYAYSMIVCSESTPVFAIIFEREMALELHEIQILDTLLKSYGLILKMKSHLLEGTIISNALARKYQQAFAKSLTDALTKLYNREALFENIRQNLQNTPYMIIFYDLDKFKYINDTFGHRAGDQVLIWFAQMIKEFSNELGGDAYRYGGDEFISIFPGGEDLMDLVSNNLENFIRKVRQKEFVFAKILDEEEISYNPDETTYVDDASFRHKITTSIGLYYNKYCLPFEVAKEKADSGLYQSKHAGRDMVTIIPYDD